MLPEAPAIEQVLLHERVLGHVRGRTIIQMGTITPEQSVAIGRRVEESGGEYLEAPVLGGVPHVKEGAPKVLVGGQPELHKRWESLLESFGSVHYIGRVGSAAAMKSYPPKLLCARRPIASGLG
jgi:3-hydroxyisobutyrate dehydrogenase